MQSEKTLPVTYALTVARAYWELANDAVTAGDLPKPMAAAMSGAANSATLRLETFLTSQGQALDPDVVRAIHHAQADLNAMAQLAGLVVTQTMTPKNTAHVALSARYTADQVVHRLKDVEAQLDH